MPSNRNVRQVLSSIVQMDLKALSKYSGVPFPPIQYKHRAKLAQLFQTALILAESQDKHEQLLEQLGLDKPIQP